MIVTMTTFSCTPDPRHLSLGFSLALSITLSALSLASFHLSENVIRVELLEHFIRDHMNRTAPRALVVLNPLKVNPLLALVPWRSTVVASLSRARGSQHHAGDAEDVYLLGWGAVLPCRRVIEGTACCFLPCIESLFGFLTQVVISNMGESEVEELEAKHWPDAADGDPEKTYKVRRLTFPAPVLSRIESFQIAVVHAERLGLHLYRVC